MPASTLRQLPGLLEKALILAMFSLVLTTSVVRLQSTADQVRVHTTDREFDYLRWTLDATWIKLTQHALGMPHYLSADSRQDLVREHIALNRRTAELESRLNLIYTDPNIADPESASAELRHELETMQRRQDRLAPFAASVIQAQISMVIHELGLAVGGQPIPPVLYNMSRLPLSLVVSPRDRIQQDAGISLVPDLNVDEQAAIEANVDSSLDVASLVVPVGGIGTYPTMVMRTSDLNWLSDTVAHEWIHNYLTLRPLGFMYERSHELRTMNETTASIAGTEIGQLVIASYYPEVVNRAAHTNSMVSWRASPADPDDIPRKRFSVRAELHETRVTVDALLSEGKIEEAEAYMEQRRKFFWDNGYPIRKLNQAYFAFYGAYADVPGGAAGQDPVGPAVRALRERSASLAAFVKQISWFTSFDQLQSALAR